MESESFNCAKTGLLFSSVQASFDERGAPMWKKVEVTSTADTREKQVREQKHQLTLYKI